MAKDLLRERLAKYTPPKERWTPVDEALYGVDDIYNVPEGKAKKLRKNAIRYSFAHHYNNKFYHEYCKQNNVSPDDIKNEEDFKKIPLIPSSFFKDHPPAGPDFIKWLRNIYTGKLPEIELSARPTYDEIIEKLEEKGIIMTHSSGSTGEFTFIPRDQITLSRLIYSVHSTWFNLAGIDSSIYYISITPDPRYNFMTACVCQKGVYDIFDNAYFAIEQKLSLQSKGSDRYVSNFSSIIERIRANSQSGKKSLVVSVPLVIKMLSEEIAKTGNLILPQGSFVLVSGGSKDEEGKIIKKSDLVEDIENALGIPPHNVRDMYMAAECNSLLFSCEGGFMHIPQTLMEPFVLDEEMEPLPYGSEGRFAFLDPTPNSYPGFIATDDKVKFLDHCPVCDRPGPVIEPPITRMPGAEDRGCARAMGKLLQGI